MENKRSTETINTVKSWFFENIYIKFKTLKLLAMLGKNKQTKETTHQYQKINEWS